MYVSVSDYILHEQVNKELVMCYYTDFGSIFIQNFLIDSCVIFSSTMGLGHDIFHVFSVDRITVFC